MEHRLDEYLAQLDREFAAAQCTCIFWSGDNPECPIHGEEACWTEYENGDDEDEQPGIL